MIEYSRYDRCTVRFCGCCALTIRVRCLRGKYVVITIKRNDSGPQMSVVRKSLESNWIGGGVSSRSFVFVRRRNAEELSVTRALDGVSFSGEISGGPIGAPLIPSCVDHGRHEPFWAAPTSDGRDRYRLSPTEDP